MTEAKIRARKIYRNITKAGKPYTRILGHTGLYYIKWSAIAEAIKEGMMLNLDIDPKPDEKSNFKINKIISFEDVKQEKSLEPATISTESIADNVSARLHKAKMIVCKEFNLQEHEINPDSVVLAECFRQLYGTVWLTRETK